MGSIVPVREVARRSDYGDRVLIHGLFDSRRLNAKFVVDGNNAELKVEVLSRFVEGRVRGDRDDQLRFDDALGGPGESRYVFIASRMLSEPPDVTEPQTPSSLPTGAPTSAPCSMWAVIEIISASNLAALGHRSVWSGLACECRA